MNTPHKLDSISVAKRDSLGSLIFKNIMKKMGHNMKGGVKKTPELAVKGVASIIKSLVKKVIVGGILIAIGAGLGFNFGVSLQSTSATFYS